MQVFKNMIVMPASLLASFSDYAAANKFQTSWAAVQFVTYNNGDGGDYHLQAGSPGHLAATDGKDIGTLAGANGSVALNSTLSGSVRWIALAVSLQPPTGNITPAIGGLSGVGSAGFMNFGIPTRSALKGS